MLLEYATLVALHVVSLIHGKPASAYETRTTEPQDITQDIDKLKTYAQAAYERTQAELNDTDDGKQGNCSLSNLRVRKEWYACLLRSFLSSE